MSNSNITRPPRASHPGSFSWNQRPTESEQEVATRYGLQILPLPEDTSAESISGEWEPVDFGRMSPEQTALRGIAKQLELDPEKAEAFSKDLSAYLKNLINVKTADLPAMPDLPATRPMMIRGALTAGAAAYATSFMIANYIGKLVSVWNPIVGALMLPVIAGPLHALISEPVAGSIRSNWGMPLGPDAAISANFTTAHSMLWAARIENNLDKIHKWEQVLVEINKAAKEQGDEVTTRFGNHQVLAAMMRAFLSEDLPFLSFTAAYLLTGATQPYTRMALGGPDKLHAIILALVDGSISAIGGVMGGIGTAGLSNLQRSYGQKAKTKAGMHVPEMHNAAIERCEYLALKLNTALAELKTYRNACRASDDPAVTKALAQIDEAVENLRARITRNEVKKASFNTLLGRQFLAIERSIAAYTGMEGKNTALWHTEESSRLRIGAKVLVNMTVLMPAVMHLIHLNYLLTETIPLSGAPEYQDPEQNNTMWGNSTMPGIEPQVSAALWGTMTVGASLIGGWLFRPLLIPAYEHVGGVVIGLKNRYFGDSQQSQGNDKNDKANDGSPIPIGSPRRSSLEGDERTDDESQGLIDPPRTEETDDESQSLIDPYRQETVVDVDVTEEEKQVNVQEQIGAWPTIEVGAQTLETWGTGLQALLQDALGILEEGIANLKEVMTPRSRDEESSGGGVQ